MDLPQKWRQTGLCFLLCSWVAIGYRKTHPKNASILERKGFSFPPLLLPLSEEGVGVGGGGGGWLLGRKEEGKRGGGKWVMGLLKKLSFEPTRHFLPLPFFSFSAEARLSSLSSGSQLLFTPKPNSSSDFLGGEEEEEEEEEATG